MTEQRTPRVWNKGDDEPPHDVTRLRRPNGEDVVRLGTGWWYVDTDEAAPTSERLNGWSWPPSSPTSDWPLTEVLPDPEDGGENGTETAQDATNTPSLSVDPGNTTEELRIEMLALAASLRLESARVVSDQLAAHDPRPLDRRLRAYADDVDEIAGKLVGWRAPLPAVSRPSREELGEAVREIATAWSLESDDRPGAGLQSWAQLEPELQEMYMRCGEQLFDLGRESAPLPAGEVEWGYRLPNGKYHIADEAHARLWAHPAWRPVGPWTEVVQ